MKEELKQLQGFVDRELGSRSRLRILEAGCGAQGYLDWRQESYTVGIDISEKQLQRNSNLNERILGDIQSYHFQPNSFDVIVCYDVLEHLPKPEAALQRFQEAIKLGGLIILKLPNVMSVKGLMTKFLPYWVHVVVKRKYFHRRKKDSKADLEDAGPFRTYLRFSIAPKAIMQFAKQQGLHTAYFETFDVTSVGWFRRKRLVHAAYQMVRAIAGAVSFGRLGDSEFILVLQRPVRGGGVEPLSN